MTVTEILDRLKALGSEHHRQQFSHFGITTNEAYGVTSPDIQILAKEIGKNHDLAIALHEHTIHEAKLIAAFLAIPKELTMDVMDRWVSQLYSWDLCDNLCMHLLRKSPLAEEAAFKWISDDREFVRRSGLVVMTSLSIHNKKASNDELIPYSEAAIPYSNDERNFVKKAISWLLRTQGKRNLELRDRILSICEEVASTYPESKSARWIVSDVRRELMKPGLIERLEKRKK